MLRQRGRPVLPSQSPLPDDKMYPPRHAIAGAQLSPFVHSPIARLPVELLSEIFSLCVLASDDVEELSEGAVSSRPPVVHAENLPNTLLLASVSRRWRYVALNQANLWSNICISPQLLGERDGADHKLYTLPIVDCLQRSRRYPLNIMIDARDANWDFTEAGVGEDDSDTAVPPVLFSSENMRTVIDLLVPHMTRWKSLTILTDTWAPMHTALCAMNPTITTSGAPLLQWLTLMRCNEFVSFSPEFQPRNLVHPAFLSCEDDLTQTAVTFPKLKHLSLRGVHVDWPALSKSVSSSLKYIDLHSHCPQVRPTVQQFSSLLAATPLLRELVVSGSGPELPEELDEIPQGITPTALPHLETLKIGYRSDFEGRVFLKSIHAPNAKTLTLEDTSYFSDPEEVNGSSLVIYLGSLEDNVPMEETDLAFNGLKCAQLEQGSTKEYPPRAMFPLLESVHLRRVKASASSLSTLFASLAHLKHLELNAMPIAAAYALLPSAPVEAAASSSPTSTLPVLTPCPELQTLCLKAPHHLQDCELEHIVSGLCPARMFGGAKALKEVNIHVDATRAESLLTMAVCLPGTEVNIIVCGDDSSDEEEDEGDCEVDMYDYEYEQEP